jgi:hypothetical protein
MKQTIHTQHPERIRVVPLFRRRWQWLSRWEATVMLSCGRSSLAMTSDAGQVGL